MAGAVAGKGAIGTPHTDPESVVYLKVTIKDVTIEHRGEEALSLLSPQAICRLRRGHETVDVIHVKAIIAFAFDSPGLSPTSAGDRTVAPGTDFPGIGPHRFPGRSTKTHEDVVDRFPGIHDVNLTFDLALPVHAIRQYRDRHVASSLRSFCDFSDMVFLNDVFLAIQGIDYFPRIVQDVLDGFSCVCPLSIDELQSLSIGQVVDILRVQSTSTSELDIGVRGILLGIASVAIRQLGFCPGQCRIVIEIDLDSFTSTQVQRLPGRSLDFDEIATSGNLHSGRTLIAPTLPCSGIGLDCAIEALGPRSILDQGPGRIGQMSNGELFVIGPVHDATRLTDRPQCVVCIVDASKGDDETTDVIVVCPG